MREVDLEAAATAQGADQPGCLVRLELPGSPARGAMKMAVVRRWKDVELLAAVGAVTVADETQLLEDVEGPVHG